jgi:hypothetical protein
VGPSASPRPAAGCSVSSPAGGAIPPAPITDRCGRGRSRIMSSPAR